MKAVWAAVAFSVILSASGVTASGPSVTREIPYVLSGETVHACLPARHSVDLVLLVEDLPGVGVGGGCVIAQAVMEAHVFKHSDEGLKAVSAKWRRYSYPVPVFEQEGTFCGGSGEVWHDDYLARLYQIVILDTPDPHCEPDAPAPLAGVGPRAVTGSIHMHYH